MWNWMTGGDLWSAGGSTSWNEAWSWGASANHPRSPSCRLTLQRSDPTRSPPHRSSALWFTATESDSLFASCACTKIPKFLRLIADFFEREGRPIPATTCVSPWSASPDFRYQACTRPCASIRWNLAGPLCGWWGRSQLSGLSRLAASYLGACLTARMLR